jgi:WD40 repeat protein/DNA-binding SARP family transcriptional activator
MANLSVRTLGPFQALLDGEILTGFDSDKVRALLVYLTLEADRPHRREKLAGLLWPDYPDRSARTNLRSALANLRKVVGDQNAEPKFILVTRQTIQFNQQSDYELDAQQFSELVEVGTDHTANAKQLEKAIALYRGDFMEGFSLPDSSIFEEWMLVTRESLRRGALQALQHLAGYYQDMGSYDLALELALRQVDMEPFQEAAHQQAMWILVLSGRRNEALSHYENLKITLETELGVAPLKQTQEMYQRILDGEQPDPPTEVFILRREPKIVGECPYRGLAAFREVDSPFYHGREQFVQQLVEALQQRSLVGVILGSSGTGKSSVIHAGLLPRLRHEEGWLFITFRPGSHPFQAMAIALMTALEQEMSEADRLIEAHKLAQAMESGDLPLTSALERVLEKNPKTNRLLLVVDQFEELYTLCPQPELRNRFIDTLIEASETGMTQRTVPVVLLMTLRADFMGQVLGHRPLADALQDNTFNMGPMNREELQAAIQNPAENQGAAFEAGLVNRILDDVGEEPGNLPLLEFALTQLWEHLDQGWLTHAVYEQIGQVGGALARYAEEVYLALEAQQREDAQRIFVQLVQPGRGTEDTRRLAARHEIGAGRWDLIQHLADKRLVVTGQDEEGRETVEIIHEALIREWDRLKGWMDADRAFRTWQEGLRANIRQWEASDKDEGALLRGAPLVQAEAWLGEREDHLSRAEIGFIETSADLNARQQVRRERRRRMIVAGLTVGLLIALVLVLLAGQQWQRAESASQLAIAREATATVAQGQAEAQADARATQQVIVEEQARLARARELSMASISNLDVDPELSTLLALHAVNETYQEDATVLQEAEDALHKAVQASRVLLTLPYGSGIAFSPDGNWLFTAGPENTAQLLDASTGEALVTFSGHSDQLMNVAFSPDGGQVATTSKDGTAKIWIAETGEIHKTLSGHTDGLVSPAFSPDGTLLATTSLDGTARVWDTQSGEELQTLPHTGLTGGVDFSPDGNRLAIADHDAFAVKVWDTTTWQEIITLTGHTDNVNDVVFNWDGSRLASASSDGTAKIWDAETGEELLTLEGHNGFVFGIEFSPDGTQVATGGVDATAKIWDTASGRELFTLAGHATGINNVAFSPDGKQLATDSAEGVKIWNITPEGSRELVTLAGHNDVAFRLDYSPDGSLLATSGFDGIARVWDLSSGKALHILEGHTHLVYDAKFNIDGSRLATGSYDGTAIVWDTTSGRMLLHIEGQCGSINSVAFSPDDARLLTGCEDGTAKVWDAATGEKLLTLEGHGADITSDVFGVAFSPNGEYLATAGWDGTAKVWDAASGQELLTLSGHIDRVNHVAFSPDGKYLATASWDGTAKVWEITSGDEVSTLSGHSGIVWVVAFSPDGNQLATSSLDNTAKVWDLVTGQELLTLTGHQGGATGLAFSPDGRHLAVGGGDGTVRIYVLSIEELITLAQERLTRSLTDAECQQYLHVESCPSLP